jgi:hypothetical protein
LFIEFRRMDEVQKTSSDEWNTFLAWEELPQKIMP